MVPNICPRKDWNGFLGWTISFSVRTHANDFKEKSLRNARTKHEERMAFSEEELAFLALIFIFALVIWMLGRNGNTSTAKKTKKEEKGTGKGIRVDRS